jgi:hypothetical protein
MADQELIAALNESGHFQHFETLGKGSFGYVVRACRRTADSTQAAGEALAIKLLPRAEVSGLIWFLYVIYSYKCGQGMLQVSRCTGAVSNGATFTGP